MGISEILESIGKVRVGVVGDFCLDVYWHADMRRSELSRETPHYPLPIVSERMSPGGAGNVAANLCALHPACCVCLGVLGKDWRGSALMEELRNVGADVSGIVTAPGWQTNTYIKPLRQGLTDVVYEDPRLDFTNYGPLPEDAEDALLRNLETVSKTVDALCVCDQMPFGCITERLRERIQALGAEGLPVVVDSRYRIGMYRNVVVKPNCIEACETLGVPDCRDVGDYLKLALSMESKTGRPAVITLGGNGSVVSDHGKAELIPAVPVDGEIDICGAGDTFLASLAAAIGCGAALADAAGLGNLASSVTIRKIRQTGTASPEEIRKAAEDACIPWK